MKKEFPVLYKYTSKGQPQQWQIFVENDRFWTEEGIVGGVISKSAPSVCKPKNVGRANATTPEQQAIAEAAAKHQKKLDAHYNEVLQEERSFFEPMLAKDYNDYVPDFKERVFVQPKLDGLRATNDGKQILSRNGKPYVATPHLLHDLKDVILDGELYTHEYKDDFNKIVSLCKKQKPTAEELQESAEKVQYWVYDLPTTKGGFYYRYLSLQRLEFDRKLPKGVVIVPTYEVHSEEEIKDLHAQFIGEGYEGTIVRIDGTPYENKRSKNLLKFKDFKDEEFTIVGAEEGEGGRAGTIGFFIMQHDKNPEQTFKSNIKGSHEYLRHVWEHKDEYIGLQATVKYFNRTPKTETGGDVPRFPFVINIDRQSYEG